MKPDTWELLKNNFERLSELEGTAFDEAISRLCGGDPVLADEMRKLFAANKAAGEFLEEPAIVPTKILTEHLLFQPGELVAGRFKIIRFIAEGGIGQVYEAEDLVLEEKVALKVISLLTGKESAWALLKQEIQSARRVTHPNVCRIHDVVEHGGLMLMTMELLEGVTLTQYLKERGPIQRNEALQLIWQMAAGLQSAHDSGVIHRDFKPGNVMLLQKTNDIQVKIMDFGLASPLSTTPKQESLRAGTPGYMAPEQASGGLLTSATDVYALGAVIQEMLGTRTTTTSKTPQSKDSQPGLGSWKHVLELCLAEDPAKRYQRPVDVAATLQQIQRRKWQIPVFVGGFLLILFLATFYWPRSARAPVGTGPVIRQVAECTSGYQGYAVSPDGKWVAALDRSRQLLLCDLRLTKIRSLTAPSTNGRAYVALGTPMFSRDSSKIAYTWILPDGHAELRVIDIDGRNNRSVLSVRSPFILTSDWFPDGSRILILLRESDGTQLAIASVATGSLTIIPGTAEATARAKVSPDATEAWFTTSRGIFAVTMSDHRLRTLISDESNNVLVGISSDGSRLLFLKQHNNENSLWTVRMVKGSPIWPAELAVTGIGRVIPLGITRSGEFFFWQNSIAALVQVGAIDVDAGIITDAPHPVAPQIFGQVAPQWSGEGRLSFYTMSGIAKMLYVLEPNGTLRGISIGLDEYASLQWRTSHSLVGFGKKNGQAGYYDVNAETGKAEILIPAPLQNPDTPGYGVWSSDGNTWYNWEAGLKRIFRYDIRSRTRQIVHTLKPGMEVNSSYLALSPGTETLAFISTQSHFEQCDLTLIPTRGGQPRFLFAQHRPTLFTSNITWLPNSRGLLVGIARENVQEVWKVPVNGTIPTKIDFRSVPGLNHLGIHPDGKKITFQSLGQEKAELKVLENFLPRR